MIDFIFNLCYTYFCISVYMEKCPYKTFVLISDRPHNINRLPDISAGNL